MEIIQEDISILWNISLGALLGVLLAIAFFRRFTNLTYKEIIMSFKSFFFGPKSPVELKIDEETMRLLNITTKVKEKELELEQVGLQLKNAKLHQSLELQEEKHKHRLDMEAAEDKLSRTRANLTEDAARRELHLKEEHTLELDKLKTYLKLESEQAIVQGKMDHKRDLANVVKKYEDTVAAANLTNVAELTTMKVKNAEDISEIKSELAKEYYDKMQDALSKMTLEGSSQSKFVQDLALKMFDKPSLPAIAELNVNAGKGE